MNLAATVVTALVLASPDAYAPNIDPAFMPYVQEFVRATDGIGVYNEYLIIFAPMEKASHAAECHFNNTNNAWAILVNVDIWATIQTEERRTIIYHELTHCALRYHGHALDPRSYMFYAPSSRPQRILDREVRVFLDLFKMRNKRKKQQ